MSDFSRPTQWILQC